MCRHATSIISQPPLDCEAPRRRGRGNGDFAAVHWIHVCGRHRLLPSLLRNTNAAKQREAGALVASGSTKTSASIAPEDAAKQAAVADGVSLNPPLQASNVTITSNAQTVTVTVQYQFQLFTSFCTESGVLTLQRQSTMNIAPLPGN